MSRQHMHTALNEHPFKLELVSSSMASSPGSLPTSPVSIAGHERLPTSVRGAAPELRKIIRKRQNSESAKRCRERKKIEDARSAQEFVMQVDKVNRLENVVAHLARRLEETRFMLLSLTGGAGGTPEAPQQPTLCVNGQTRCNGTECALCVRGATQSEEAARMTEELSGEFHMAQRVDEHTVQLQQMLSGGAGTGSACW